MLTVYENRLQSKTCIPKRDDRIKAHFTTCFIALTLFCYLEKELDLKLQAAKSYRGNITLFFEIEEKTGTQ